MMKTLLKFTGMVGATLVLSGRPALAEQPVGKQLSVAEIKSSLIGKTARYNNKKGKNISVFWKEDGTMAGQVESASSRRPIPGSWKITDDGQLCVSWSSSKMESGCRTLFIDEKTGEIRTYNAEGTPVATITEILPGNPNNL